MAMGTYMTKEEIYATVDPVTHQVNWDEDYAGGWVTSLAWHDDASYIALMAD